MQTTTQPADWTFRAIATLVAAVALWLLAMPCCRFVQQTAMERYHLQTPSFVLWALQGPVPAMYSFHNRYQLEPQPWDASFFSQSMSGTINHFPVRLYTFGETRGQLLGDVDRRMLTIQSRYRGHQFVTRWIATPASDGGFELADEVLP